MPRQCRVCAAIDGVKSGTTGGYGVLWHTFRPGKYDFGATKQDRVILTHNEDYLDMFFMVNEAPTSLLADFYQLTGNPVLLPKFGFYQGHLNAYNRDYWTPAENGFMLYEDGKRYNESQKDNGGIRSIARMSSSSMRFSACRMFMPVRLPTPERSTSVCFSPL